MSDLALAVFVLICAGGIITLNVLNVLEKVKPADTITIGPEQYPQCQLTVQREAMEELGAVGMWDWMAQCVVDAKLKGQADE